MKVSADFGQEWLKDFHFESCGSADRFRLLFEIGQKWNKPDEHFKIKTPLTEKKP